MPPRAYAVVLPIALAAWLASFLTGCSGADDPPSGSDATTATVVWRRPGIRYVTSRVERGFRFSNASPSISPGTENNGGDVIARTDAADRRGLYFIIGLDRGAKLPGGSVAILEFVSSETVEPKKYVFALNALDDAGLFREIRLGVTGKDWPAKPVPQVVAWKITLCHKTPGPAIIADTGVVIAVGTGAVASSPAGLAITAKAGPAFASSQSFLWSLPGKPVSGKP